MFGYSAHHPILYPIYPDHTHTHTHTHTRCVASPLHNPLTLYIIHHVRTFGTALSAVWVPTPRTTCTPTPTTQRDVADVADDDDDDAHGCRRRHRIARASRRRRRHRRRRRQRRCGARQHHQGWLRAHGEKGEPDAERRARGAV